MSNSVAGKVIHIEPTQAYGAKGFKKRQVVLEQDKGTFSNYIPIDVTRDLCEEVDWLKVGDEVEFAYRLNGRKWQKDESSEVRYFLSAEALSFSLLKSAPAKADTVDDEQAPF